MIPDPVVTDLPDVVALASRLPQADPAEASAVLQAVVSGVREILGMDVAFIGAFDGDRRVITHVDAASPRSRVLRAGDSAPVDTTYCQRVVDGRLPGFIPDAAAEPEAAELAATADLPVGTHLSVPIEFSDGEVYGTFCAFTHEPDPLARERDLGTLRLLARLLAQHIEREVRDSHARARAAADILEVLARGSVTTVFQPIIDLRTSEAAGFEALSRFPTGSPDEWFGRAAQAGIGISLELAAFDEALRHVAEVPDGAYLAVNLSPAALCAPQFEARADGLPMHRLVVELTEQTEAASYEELAVRVRWLRERGGRVAVDDAGSGYAGLQRIVAITPDILKLDRELTRGIAADPARQAMAAAMAWFAARIGASLVAEGVENVEDLVALRGLGVDYVQGYHLARPGALAD